MILPKIYGLIGYPVKHSRSPIMHNAAFQALKIPAEYILIPVEPKKLEDFLINNKKISDIDGNPVSIQDLSGFNITIPHKVKAKEILVKKFPYTTGERVQPDLYYVGLSGAVNTVKREGNELKYYNTDAAGFFKALEADLKFEIKDKSALLIGCGGAGRAIIASLSWKNRGINKIYVYEISAGAVESTKEHFSNLSSEWRDNLAKKVEFVSDVKIKEAISRCQLFVNASSVGMKEGDPSPIDKNLLHKDLSVYDVVYNRKTQLIKDAESLGLNAKDGLGMLVYQGAVAFELWLPGQKAPVEVMRKVLEEELKR